MHSFRGYATCPSLLLSKSKALCLCGLAGRGKSLAHLEAGLRVSSQPSHPSILSRVESPCKTHLLPQPHNLEALKVVELPPPDTPLTALGPGAVVPPALNIGRLPQLLQGSGTGGARELLNDDGSEGDVGDRNGLAGDNVLLLRVRGLDQDLGLRG